MITIPDPTAFYPSKEYYYVEKESIASCFSWRKKEWIIKRALAQKAKSVWLKPIQYFHCPPAKAGGNSGGN